MSLYNIFKFYKDIQQKVYQIIIPNNSLDNYTDFFVGPNSELPVKVTGDITSGFTAEFMPRDVGVYSISVEYNGYPVNGTPFLAKAFNADKVLIGPVARGSVGQPTHFTGAYI